MLRPAQLRLTGPPHDPMHAYASSMALFAFFHAWHLIIAVVTAGLVVARLYPGGSRVQVRDASRWLLAVVHGVAGVVTIVLIAALS
jgi:hypothetical protein